MPFQQKTIWCTKKQTYLRKKSHQNKKLYTKQQILCVFVLKQNKKITMFILITKL